MKYCFGSVSWSGYLERYVDIFVDNYIRLFKELIRVGVNYTDIADPIIVYANDIEGFTRNGNYYIKVKAYIRVVTYEHGKIISQYKDIYIVTFYKKDIKKERVKASPYSFSFCDHIF